MLLAQISDIHASDKNDNLHRLRAVVEWLLSIRPDAIIVTGDLIDDDWIDGYSEIEALLAQHQCPLSIIPGNSDSPHIMRQVLGQLDCWHHPSALHTIRTLGSIRVVGVDTRVDGKTYGDIICHLDWLGETLDIVKSSDETTILFTHHHLFPTGIDPIDKIMCLGAVQFEQFISARLNKPIAICSGHVHRAMFSTIANVPSYICGSVCAANPLLLDDVRTPPVTDPPAIMLHDFRSGRLVSSNVSI
ncbi:metallophosphoesterase [Allorhizobium terrae]|uniref:Metallophosphoesterase n=1 Tax=Allorhizobium terrae TaxID=1848972 RepID=A0A4S3ZWC4_9HYPH|nr:metallophosphoesterase [Allorhizobium terrae]THF50034.1 metallophosphoesterase [Allorhizobium terrae]